MNGALFVDVNETTMKLHRACIKGDVDTVNNILRINKAKIDAKQLDQMGTLLQSVSHEKLFPSLKQLQEMMKNDPQVEIIKLLCEMGIDLEQKDSSGKTALHLAIRGNKKISGSDEFHENPRIVKILLEHGASVYAKDIYGHTPLHKACESGNLEIVQALIEHHADVHAKHHYGETPLHVASWSGNLEVMKTLIQHHADLHAMDEIRETPLHKACWGGHLEIVQEFLKYKPNINAVSQGVRVEVWPPLMCAAYSGHFEVVEELLNHGADIDFFNPKYGSVLHLAIENEYYQIVNILLKNGCNTKVRANLF